MDGHLHPLSKGVPHPAGQDSRACTPSSWPLPRSPPCRPSLPPHASCAAGALPAALQHLGALHHVCAGQVPLRGRLPVGRGPPLPPRPWRRACLLLRTPRVAPVAARTATATAGSGWLAFLPRTRAPLPSHTHTLALPRVPARAASTTTSRHTWPARPRSFPAAVPSAQVRGWLGLAAGLRGRCRVGPVPGWTPRLRARLAGQAPMLAAPLQQPSPGPVAQDPAVPPCCSRPLPLWHHLPLGRQARAAGCADATPHPRQTVGSRRRSSSA